MTKEEKIKFIEENRNKNNLFISPRRIQGGARLFHDFETVELYEKMGENTKLFAEKQIVNLISDANYKKEEVKDYLSFSLIFRGDFDDLPNDLGSPSDFIINNKDKILAIYRYVKSSEERHFFVGFDQTETIDNYGYLYLNLSQLLEEFEKNNISYKIDKVIDRFAPSMYFDDSTTNFEISYNPIKVKDIKEKVLKK